MLASGERGACRAVTPFGAASGDSRVSTTRRHRRKDHQSDAHAGPPGRLVWASKAPIGPTMLMRGALLFIASLQLIQLSSKKELLAMARSPRKAMRQFASFRTSEANGSSSSATLRAGSVQSLQTFCPAPKTSWPGWRRISALLNSTVSATFGSGYSTRQPIGTLNTLELSSNIGAFYPTSFISSSEIAAARVHHSTMSLHRINRTPNIKGCTLLRV